MAFHQTVSLCSRLAVLVGCQSQFSIIKNLALLSLKLFWTENRHLYIEGVTTVDKCPQIWRLQGRCFGSLFLFYVEMVTSLISELQKATSTNWCWTGLYGVASHQCPPLRLPNISVLTGEILFRSELHGLLICDSVWREEGGKELD